MQHGKHSLDEVVIDRATDATVAQFDHLVIRGDDQPAVDPDLADFVDDDPNLEALLFRQNMVPQGRLAAAEKAGDNCARPPLLLLSDAHRQKRYRWYRPPIGSPRHRMRSLTHAERASRCNGRR